MNIKILRNIECNLWTKNAGLLKIAFMKELVAYTISFVCGRRFDDLKFEVSFCFSSEELITDCNKFYRGKDKSTDVLSFSEFDFTKNKWEEVFALNSGGLIYLGDVIFSYQNIRRDAESIGIPFKDRLTHLTVHSVLHLLGFDHLNKEDEALMEKMEADILSHFNLKNPYLVT